MVRQADDVVVDAQLACNVVNLSLKALFGILQVRLLEKSLNLPMASIPEDAREDPLREARLDN